MIVNQIILAILLGLSSDVQGVLSIDNQALHSMITDNIFTNLSPNPDFHRRLMIRATKSPEYMSVLNPYYSGKVSTKDFLASTTDYIKNTYLDSQSGLDSFFTPFAIKIKDLVKSKSFKPSNPNDQSNLTRIFSDMDSAFKKNQKEKASSVKPSSNSGKDPRKFSVNPSGTTIQTTTKITGTIRAKMITTLFISITGKSRDREEIIQQLYSYIYKQFAEPNGSFDQTLVAIINPIYSFINRDDFDPSNEDHKQFLIQMFESLGRAYDRLSESNNIDDPSQVMDGIHNDIDPGQVADLVYSFVLNHRNEDGSYHPTIAPIVDGIFAIINKPDFDSKDSNTQNQLQMSLERLDYTYKLIKNSNEQNVQLTPESEIFINYLIGTPIENKSDIVTPMLRLFKSTYQRPDGDFDPAIKSEIRELNNLINSDSFDPKDEEIKREIVQSLTKINFLWVSKTNEGKKSAEVAPPPPMPRNASSKFKDLINSFDAAQSGECPTIRISILKFVESQYSNENGGFNPEIQPLIDQVYRTVNSVDFDLTRSDVKAKLMTLMNRLEAAVVQIPESSVKDDIQTPDSSAETVITPAITGDKQRDKGQINDMVNDMTMDTKPLVSSYINNYIESYFANPEGGFDFNMYSKVTKVINFVNSEEFKPGDSKSLATLDEMLNELEISTKNVLKTGPYKKPNFTRDRPTDETEFLKSLSSINEFNKEDALHFLNELLSYYFGNKDGGFDFSMYSIIMEFNNIMSAKEFDGSQSTTQNAIQNLFDQLNRIVDQEKGNSNPIAPSFNYYLYGIKDADTEMVLTAIRNITPENEEQVLDFLNGFLTEYYSDDNGNFDASIYPLITDAIKIAKTPGFKGSNPNNIEKYRMLFERLDAELKNLSQPKPSAPTPFSIPEFTNDKVTDQQNFYDTLKKVKQENAKEFLPYMKEYLIRYYSDVYGQFSENLFPIISKIYKLFEEKDFNPSTADNYQTILTLLAKVQDIHDKKEGAIETIKNPYKPPTPTNNLATDLKNIIASLNRASTTDKITVENTITYFLKKNYADANGNFPGGLKEDAEQIFTFIKSEEFDPSDIVARERTQKWLAEIDLKATQLKNPKAMFGYYHVPEFTGDKHKDQEELLKSLSSINEYNKSDATNTFLKYIQSNYGNKDKTIDYSLSSSINQILGMIQSPNFDPNNPKNKNKMKELLEKLDQAHANIKEPQQSLGPYQAPNRSGDRDADLELIIQSLQSVNKANQFEFLSFLINYINEEWVKKQNVSDYVTRSIINQIVQYVESPNFDPFNPIAKEQLKSFFSQLSTYMNKINNNPHSAEVYPPIQFTYNKEKDLESLIDILQKNTTKTNQKNAANPVVQYITTFYADQDGSFDYQLSNFINQILNYISNPDTNFKDNNFITKFQELFTKLDNEYYLVKNPPPSTVNFDQLCLTGDIHQDALIFLDAMRYVNKENKPSAIKFTFRFLVQAFGNPGDTFDDKLYPLVTQIIDFIQGDSFDIKCMNQLKVLLNQLNQAHNKLLASKQNRTPFREPKLTGDKTKDIQAFFESLKSVTLANQMQAVNFANRLLMRYYAESDGTIPYSLVKPVQQIVSFVKSTECDATNQATFKRLDELFKLLDEAKKYVNNPGGNPALVEFKIPTLTNNKDKDQNILIKSLKQVNLYNTQQATNFILSFMNKYYGGNGGVIDFSLHTIINQFVSFIQSPEFDPTNSNNDHKFKELFATLDHAFSQVSNKKPISDKFVPPKITGDRVIDQQNLLDSFNTITEDSKIEAKKFIQKYLIDNYGNAGSLDPTLDKYVQDFISMVTGPDFKSPLTSQIRNMLKMQLSKMDMAYQKLKNPSSVVKGYQAPQITGNKLNDIEELIKSVKFINKSNKNQANDVFLKFLNKYYGESEGGFDFLIYPIVEEMLRFIDSSDFNPTDPNNKSHLEGLFTKLDQAALQAHQRPTEKPKFITPHLTGKVKQDQEIVLTKLKEITQVMKPDAVKFVSEFLRNNYGKTDGSFDYRMVSLVNDFMKFINNPEFFSLDHNGEVHLRDLFKQLDDEFSKLDFDDSQLHHYPAPAFTGDKVKDQNNFLETLSFIQPLNQRDAANYLSKILSHYYSNPDGGMDISIFPLFEKPLTFLKSPSFDGSNPTSRTQIQHDFKQLDEAIAKLNKDTQKVQPYIPPKLTGQFLVDSQKLVESFTTVNKDNRAEAERFIKLFLTNNFGNKDGSFNLDRTSIINKILKLISEEDFDFRNRESVDKFSKLLSELNQLASQDNGPTENPYKPPQLTGDKAVDVKNLIASFDHVDRRSQQDATQYLLEYLHKNYGVEGEGYNLTIYTIVGDMVNFISKPGIDFSKKDVQSQILLYFSQLDAALKKLNETPAKPKECNLPTLSGDKSSDQRNILDSISKLDNECSKAAIELVIKFAEHYYKNNEGVIDFTLMTYFTQLANLIESDFNVSQGDSITKIRFILGQLDKAQEQANIYHEANQPFTPPNLTGDKNRDIKNLINSLQKVKPKTKDNAINYVIQFVKRYFGKEDGSMDYPLYTVLNKLTDLMNAENFQFSNPVSISQMKKIFSEFDQVEKDYQSTQGQNYKEYLGIQYTGNIQTDFYNLMESFNCVTDANRPKAVQFVLDFAEKYFRNKDGTYDKAIFPHINQLRNLVTDKNFNFSNNEYLNKLRLIFETLEMTSQALKNPSEAPSPYPAPVLTGDKATDQKGLFDSFQYATLFNKQEVVDFISKYLAIYYGNPEGKFDPKLYDQVNRLLTTIAAPDFDLTQAENVSTIKYAIHQLDSTIKKIKEPPTDRPRYNAPDLTGNRQIDEQSLIASFKTVTKETKKDAINFVMSYLSIQYGNPDGSFDVELLDLIKKFASLISNPTFDFNKDSDVRNVQNLLIDLDVAIDRLREPKPVDEAYDPPKLSGTKYIDIVRLLNSFSKVTPYNKIQAINFMVIYLEKYYADENGSFDPQVISPLVNQVINLVSSPYFNFASIDDMTKVQSMINQLDNAIDKTRAPKTDVPYKPPKLKGNNLPYDTQAILISFRKFSPEYKSQAISSLIDFLSTYYSKQDGTWDGELYNLVNQLVSMITSPTFDFGAADSANRIQNYLFQLDIMKKKLKNTPVKPAEYLAPTFSGDFRIDELNLIESFKSVNSYNQPDAINFIMKFLTNYFADKKGQFDIELYQHVNQLVNTITKPGFDLTSPDSPNIIQRHLIELEKVKERITKPGPEKPKFYAPVLTDDEGMDREFLIKAFRLVTPDTSNGAINAMIEFLKRHFGEKDGKFNGKIEQYANQIVRIITTRGFQFQNEQDIAKINPLLDQIEEEHRRQTAPKPIGITYNPPIYKGDREADLKALINSLRGLTNSSKSQVINTIIQFIEVKYKNSDGSMDQKVNALSSSIVNLIRNETFNFENQQDIQKLIDLLQQLDRAYVTANSKTPEQLQTLEPPKWTGNRPVDTQSLIDYLRKVSVAPPPNPKLVSMIMGYISTYYSSANGSIDQNYKQTVDQLIQKITKFSFSFKDLSNIDQIAGCLHQLDTLKEELNAPKPKRIYSAPQITGNKDQDKKSLFNSWVTVNEDNKSDAIDFFITYLNKHYTNSKGSFEYSINLIVNKIFSKITSKSFNFVEPSSLQQVKDLLDELDSAYRRLNAPVEIAFIAPQLTGNKEIDRDSLIKSLKIINPSNLDHVTDFMLQYINTYFAGPDGDIDDELFPWVSKLIDLVSDPKFNGKDVRMELKVNAILFEMDQIYDQITPTTYNQYYGAY